MNDGTKEVSFFNNYTTLAYKDFKNLKNPVILPSNSLKDIRHSNEILDNNEFKKLDLDTILSYTLAMKSSDFINADDLGLKSKNSHIKNTLKHDDKEISIKDISLNKRAKSASNALLKLSVKAGVGNLIHVPLIHSGFWVTLKPMNNEEIVDLELNIINDLNTLGKTTNTLGFSNYSVTFTETIIRFFVDKINSATLSIDDDDDYINYININDVNIIALSMAKSLYPKGMNKIFPCKNTIANDDAKLPKCDYRATMKVNLEDLLWVDESLLDIEHLNQLSKKLKNSVSVEEVLTYQKTLNNLKPDTKSYINLDGEEVAKITFKSPTIARYLEFGNLFLDTLKNTTNDMIKDMTEVIEPEDAKALIVKTIYLQIYNHYVDSITVDDSTLSSVSDINEGLAILSSIPEIKDKVMDDIRDYISDTLVATVGVPNFVCPDCNDTQSEDTIIPISTLEYFFTLLHSRYQIIMELMRNK